MSLCIDIGYRIFNRTRGFFPEPKPVFWSASITQAPVSKHTIIAWSLKIHGNTRESTARWLELLYSVIISIIMWHVTFCLLPSTSCQDRPCAEHMVYLDMPCRLCRHFMKSVFITNMCQNSILCVVFASLDRYLTWRVFLSVRSFSNNHRYIDMNIERTKFTNCCVDAIVISIIVQLYCPVVRRRPQPAVSTSA